MRYLPHSHGSKPLPRQAITGCQTTETPQKRKPPRLPKATVPYHRNTENARGLNDWYFQHVLVI